MKQAMKAFDAVLGILDEEKGELDEDIQKLVNKREEARKKKGVRRKEVIIVL